MVQRRPPHRSSPTRTGANRKCRTGCKRPANLRSHRLTTSSLTSTSTTRPCTEGQPLFMPAQRRPASATPASRAAALLKAQRGQSRKPAAATASATAATDSDDDKPLPLPQLIQRLTSSKTISAREAIPVAGCLVRAKLHTPSALAMLSPMALEDAGVESEELRARVCSAVGRGKNIAPKSRLAIDDNALARAYGNVSRAMAAASSSSTSRTAAAGVQPKHAEYSFAAVKAADTLQGRYLSINRSPVLCAWAVVLAERLGFNTREALSIAQCYVSITATARGVAIGKLSAAAHQAHGAGSTSTQPHFVLMGVQIPLLQLANDGEWRALSTEGTIIGPDRAFDYLRSSMRQLLPHAMGALELLADSWLTTDEASLDELHAKAFSLYIEFRPDTGGEWGKKAKFSLDAVLQLRKPALQPLKADDANSDGEGVPSEVKISSTSSTAQASDPASPVTMSLTHVKDEAT